MSSIWRTKPRPEWEAVPRYRTRSEMLAARKREVIPELSYDMDGDGVVGQKDYFIGRHFDAGTKGYLTPAEREEALSALRAGWMDQFQFGLDQAGPRRPFPVSQKRGIILTYDNVDEMGKTYEQFFEPEPDVPCPTKTQMLLERKADLKNSAQQMRETWTATHPYWGYQQPVVRDSFYVEDPPIQHIAERAHADAAAARVANGLHPTPCYVNPLRERKELGLGYVADPEARTRQELRARRSAQKVRDLEQGRVDGERTFVSKDVFVSKRETAAHDYRRPQEGADTRRKLLRRRLESKVAAEEEIRMKHLKPLSYPAFEDQEEPWWTLREEYRHAERVRASKAPPPPVVPEPPPPAVVPPPLVAPKPEAMTSREDQKHLGEKRIGGPVKNQPRVFDNLRSQHTGTYDLMPLELSSSFDWVRNQSIRQQAEQRKAHAAVPPVSRLAEVMSLSGGGTRELSFQGSKATFDTPKELSTELPARTTPSVKEAVLRAAPPVSPTPEPRASKDVYFAAGSQGAPGTTQRSFGYTPRGTPVRTGGFEIVDRLDRADDPF